MSSLRSLPLFVVPVLAPLAHAQYATAVHHYDPGSALGLGYDNPASALGEPSRFIPGDFGGAVSPFNAPYLPSQLVQVGRGGSLVVTFDQPITNDPSHPFGIDLIVFGNSFLPDANWPLGIVGGSLAADGGDIDVSDDGVHWHRVAANAADGRFPTLGYADLADPYSPVPGLVPTDFTRPVNPAFDFTPGMTFAQILAAYNGSGGGCGIDIASSGLDVVRFVRVSVAPDAAAIPEIDGFAVVPAPGAAACILLAPAALARRRR